MKYVIILEDKLNKICAMKFFSWHRKCHSQFNSHSISLLEWKRKLDVMQSYSVKRDRTVMSIDCNYRRLRRNVIQYTYITVCI